MENEYFISAFLEAARNSMFQHHYYKPPINLILDSKHLLNAITSTKWLHTALETTGNSDEELNLYRNRYRLKSWKHIYCFYAAPNGVKPTLEKAWHNYIDYGEELLQTRVIMTNTPQLSTAIPSEADLAHKRKRKNLRGHLK